MPAGGSYHTHVDEAAEHPGASDDLGTAMAEAAVVRTGSGNGQKGESSGPPFSKRMERKKFVDPAVEASAFRSEPESLDRLTAERMISLGERSTAMVRSARLVTEHGWSNWNIRTRDSQWGTWLRFCTAEIREPPPIKEDHMVVFVG